MVLGIRPDFDAGLLCQDVSITFDTLSTDVLTCGTVELGPNLVIEGTVSIVAGEKIVIRSGTQFAAGSSISLGIASF